MRRWKFHCFWFVLHNNIELCHCIMIIIGSQNIFIWNDVQSVKNFTEIVTHPVLLRTNLHQIFKLRLLMRSISPSLNLLLVGLETQKRCQSPSAWWPLNLLSSLLQFAPDVRSRLDLYFVLNNSFIYKELLGGKYPDMYIKCIYINNWIDNVFYHNYNLTKLQLWQDRHHWSLTKRKYFIQEERERFYIFSTP